MSPSSHRSVCLLDFLVFENMFRAAALNDDAFSVDFDAVYHELHTTDSVAVEHFENPLQINDSTHRTDQRGFLSTLPVYPEFHTGHELRFVGVICQRRDEIWVCCGSFIELSFRRGGERRGISYQHVQD